MAVAVFLLEAMVALISAIAGLIVGVVCAILTMHNSSNNKGR